MSEEIKKVVETVTRTMAHLSGDARERYVAVLEGAAIGAELASSRKETDHEPA